MDIKTTITRKQSDIKEYFLAFEKVTYRAYLNAVIRTSLLLLMLSALLQAEWLISVVLLILALSIQRIQAALYLRLIDHKTYAETKFHITDKRISSTMKGMKGSFDWSMFRSYLITKNLLIVFYDKNRGIMLPKRAFSEKEFDQLVTFIKAKLPIKQSPKPLKLILIGIGITALIFVAVFLITSLDSMISN